MLVFLLFITLVNQSARGSPVNLPDESISINKENYEVFAVPGIYFEPSAKSGKSLDIEENPRVASISFGTSEPVVRLPSLSTIMFSFSNGKLPKQDGPNPAHAISFGEAPVDAVIGFNDRTTDKTDTEVNVPMLFFDEPTPDEIIDRHNIPIVPKPIPAAFDVPALDDFNKLENEKELTLKQGFPILIVIEDEPIEAFLHFINSTNYDDNNEKDSDFIKTSSQSPELMFFNPIEDESSNDFFLFPTPKSSDVTGDIQGSPVILNSPKINKVQSGIGNDQSECTNGHMFYQGKCHRFLTSGPCGEKNWLILKNLNNAGCVLRPCPFGEILYNNKCVDPSNSTVCSSGQMLYVDLTGEAFCDCEPDFIYIPQDGECIPEYEQGYCEWGEYLVRNDEEIPECVPNPCKIDNTVFHRGNKRCYQKNYIGFCKEEYLIVTGEDAECAEIELDIRNIFEIPTLRRCPRGSARDILHECRRRYTMPSMSSVLTAKYLYGGCPRGWTKGRYGRCRKIRNLFG